MSKRIFCIGTIHHQRQVIAGWDLARQYFTLHISQPDEVSDIHVSGISVAEIKDQLKAQGIEAPAGFLQGLQDDAQANV